MDELYNTISFYTPKPSKANASKHIFTIHEGGNKNTFEFEEVKNNLLLGRASECDIIVNSKIVSRKHIDIFIEGELCIINDLESTNGTYVNKKLIDKLSILKNGDIISINNSSEEIIIQYNYISNNVGEEVCTKTNLITIGRTPDNDIIINHPTVSRRHAVVIKNAEGYSIEDQSTNGTFVNGKRVSKLCKLKKSDIIVIANAKLIFNGTGIDYAISDGGLSVDAINLTKKVKNKNGYKTLVDKISLSINAGEFVAIVGGSGAGKSTLMDCLNGFRPATSGNVVVNGEQFYANYNAYKNIIGYVPQKDIVYDNLTVRQMLRYSARLRMCKDSNKKEIEKRVNEVIKDVKLTGKEDLMIKLLSGGQKKRVSIAVELLADPKLLYLDEPTSGLDPGLDKSLMELLQSLSKNGKTIILVTHATSNISLCDKVVFLGIGGRLCYFGSPNGLVEFFETIDISDIYKKLSIIENEDKNDSAKPDERLIKNAEKFVRKLHALPEYKKIIESLNGKRDNTATKDRFSKPVGWYSQYIILISRYYKLIFSDTISICIMFGQAPLMVLIIKAVASSDTFDFYDSSKQLLFIISSMATIMGLLNSFLEICKEREIFKREHSVSVGLFPYIMSKVTVLSSFCLFQSIILITGTYLIIVPPNTGLTGNTMMEFWFTIFLTLLASTAIGILISSYAPNTERATLIMPLAIIPQIVFSGIMFKLEGIKEIISYGIITRWSISSLASTFDINSITRLAMTKNHPEFPPIPKEVEKLFDHTKELLFINWGVMLIISTLCLILSAIILSRSTAE